MKNSFLAFFPGALLAIGAVVVGAGGAAAAARSSSVPKSSSRHPWDDGDKRRLVSNQAPFPHSIECVPDPTTDPCTDTFSSLPNLNDANNRVIVPCGSCVKMDLAGPITVPGGLDIHGTLFFEDDGTYVDITTPFVFVQGMLDIRLDRQVSAANRRVTFTLTGASSQTFVPRDNVACAGGTCNFGKKPFVVAGGRMNVAAFPVSPSSGGSEATCPTWTKLHSVSVGGAKVLSEGQYKPKVLPPPLPECAQHVFQHAFDIQPGGGGDGAPTWTQGEGDEAGATCALEDAAQGGAGLTILDRVRSYQGPTIDLTTLLPCIHPDVDYLFIAEIKLSKTDSQGTQIVGPTSCKADGSDCLRLENWILYDDDTESETTPDWSSQTMGSAGNFDEWMTFTATIKFAPSDLNGIVFNALVLSGPQDGVDISIRSALLTLPDDSSYSDTCTELVLNGNAEGNGMHPYPTFSSSKSSRILVVEEGGNKFYRHVDRTNRWETPKFEINKHCIAQNQVYRASAKVKIHSPTPVTYRIELRQCNLEGCAGTTYGTDYVDYVLASCGPQSEVDGMVECTSDVTLPSEIESGLEYHLRFELDPTTSGGSDDEGWVIDVDDVSLAFMQGQVGSIVVDADVGGCWGPGSDIVVTSHTISWDGHQMATIDRVVQDAGPGRSRLVLVDPIAEATSQTTDPSFPDLASEVALLSRNVVIEGADDEGTADDKGGYFSIYHTRSVTQIVEGIEFRNMGQHGTKHRYPIQVHMTKSLPMSSVSKNSIVKSNHRCVALQDVQDLTVEGNVAYDHRGHCFVTMDGSETGNRFIGNLGARTTSATELVYGDSSEDDYPATFYLRGAGNYFEGNVAAGSERYGWRFHMKSSVLGESDPDYSDNPRKTVAITFKNNVAHSNTNGFVLQDYNRDDKSQHSFLENVKSYRNIDRGIQFYYSYNTGILGGFFADNEYSIDIYRSVGITPITDASIHGETSVQRDLVATQGARPLYCARVNGVRLNTYKRGNGYNLTSHWSNLHFADFDLVSECGATSQTAPIYLTDDEFYQEFDWETSMTNVTVSDTRAMVLNACEADAADRNQVLFWDTDGSFRPNSSSTANSGPGVVVSNNDKMKTFASGPCWDMPDQCISYCEDTCLRTVTFSVESDGTDDWELVVTETGGSGRTVRIDGKFYDLNEHSGSQYLRRRTYSVSIPSGTYTAEFRNGAEGSVAWPSYALEVWKPSPPCVGHANPGDVTLVVPNATVEECDDLVRDGNVEGSGPGDTSFGPWKVTGSSMTVAAGMGRGGTNALKHYARSRTYHSIGQYVDMRCVRDNLYKQYEFTAWVKLSNKGTDDGNGVCDPDEDSANLGCPEVTFRMEYYTDVDVKELDSVGATYPNPKAELVRPFRQGEWNMVHGVFAWDENKGLPMTDQASIFWYLPNFNANLDLFVDDVSITRADATCDEIVRNGDFKTGTSMYWDTYAGSNAKLDLVDGIDGGDDKALRSYARLTSTYRGHRHDLKLGCLEEGELYIFRAMYRIEVASNPGTYVACIPETTSDSAFRCPEARLRSYWRTASDTTDYGSEDGNRNLGNAAAPTSAAGWNLLAGFYKASYHEENSEELQIYFDYLDLQYNLIVDNVTLTPYERTCDNLIPNPSFEDGDTSFWMMRSRSTGRIDVTSPGADGSLYAAKISERTSSSGATLRTNIDYRCLETGQVWEVNTKFKLLNSTGGGQDCDIWSRNHDSGTNCPAFYIVAQRCDGTDESATLWNELLGFTWDKDDFNNFYAEFPVSSNLASCTDIYVYMARVNEEWDVLIDQVSISMKTIAPTPGPTMKPTSEPASSAPTIDGTYPPTAVPTNAPTMVGTDCPPVGTTQALSPGRQSLTIVAAQNELCTLTKVTTKDGAISAVVAIARSYDGYDWHTAAGNVANNLLAGQEWRCYATTCEIDLPGLDSGEEYVLSSYARSLPAKDEVARFLELVTFGTTQNDLDSWDLNSNLLVSMAVHVQEQMDPLLAPITSHRRYWRERLNAKWTFPQPAALPIHPCAPGARWRKATFSIKDMLRSSWLHYLKIRTATGSNGETKYILSQDGHDRTTVSEFKLSGPGYESYVFDSEYSYNICGINDWVGGVIRVRIELGTCVDIISGHPQVNFTGFESYAQKVLSLPGIGTGSDMLQPIDTDIGDGNEFFVLEKGLNDANCGSIGVVDYNDPPVFGKMPDGTWLHFDPRIDIRTNTPANHLADGGGSAELATAGTTICSNAPRTFLSFGECTLSKAATACGDVASPPTEIPLDDESIRKLHEISGHYIYGIKGLVVKQVNGNTSEVTYEVAHPCTPGGRSRWLKSASSLCPYPTVLQPQTNQTLTEQIIEWGEEQNNPIIRDIYFPSMGSECDASDIDVEIQIQVGDDCWTHVHPDYLSVYDMTYWTLDHTHPGNMHAAMMGHYNPIKKWMDLQNSSTLTFPSTYPENPFGHLEGNHSTHRRAEMTMDGNMTMEMHDLDHPMSRWEMHSVKFEYVGRMYDVVYFRDLPNELRLDEVASYYNATGDVQGTGIMVCGSPNEVANDPTLGEGFDLKSDDRTDTSSRSFFQKQKEMTWTMIALTAQDQLRQRMAWALSQILVVVPTAVVDGDRVTEIFLNYYDIFVRNAFGNYRDILKEISYSAVMAENLSYIQSKSHAYMRERFGQLAFADENFAREIMQLFTIGLVKLNIDGTPKPVPQEEILTYTNEDIMNFARAWTGFDYQLKRGNIEERSSTRNRLDPMRIDATWRDKFPKMNLQNGYIGDQYPLCAQLPEKMFLRKGAVYRLLGSASLPEKMYSNTEYLSDDTIRKFVLDAGSSLRTKLCSAAGTNCFSPAQNEITLDSNLGCTADECSVDTVRVVQVAPDLYYEYVRPPCVELAFYKNAKKLNKRRKSDTDTMCGNPLLPIAMEACCLNPFDFTPVAVINNTYDGERVTFATAAERCVPESASLCDFDHIDDSVAVHKTGYHWTTDICLLEIKVDRDGNIAIVYEMNAYTSKKLHVNDNTLNFFPVAWESGYPGEFGDCGACTPLSEGGCRCGTSVQEDVVYDNVMPSSVEDVLSSLYIGAMDASSYDIGVYSTDFDASTGITVHKKGTLIDIETIFQVEDDKGRVHFLRNMRSTVKITGTSFSFRNAPHFMSLLDTETDIRDAEYETEATLDYYFYHENTAPFFAIRLIQRFGISNPTPMFVKAVATAFRSGTFTSGGITFGSNKYGDLAATAAALILHPEARAIVLDEDQAHGSMREPLLKIIAFMRNLDFTTNEGNTLVKWYVEGLEHTVGQMAHMFPTVFSFFLPEFVPSGRCTSSSLVSPEAMAVDMPKVISFLNGIFSMVKYGLEDRNGGFVDDRYKVGELMYDSSGKDSTSIVDELATLLTSGRLSTENRQIVVDAVNEAVAQGGEVSGRLMAQQLIATSPEFHSTNVVKKNGSARPPAGSQSGGTLAPYKAVVFLMFAGGCDSFNMLVPHTCTAEVNETDLQSQYVEIRENVALVRESLLPINGTNQGCEIFGIHPNLPVLHQLYNDNHCLFVANAGVLNKPTDKYNYRQDTVTQLFAHNTMQREGKRVDPFDASVGTGVLGRMVDVLIRNGYKASGFSIDTESIALVGKPGKSPTPNIISNNGISEFNAEPTTNATHMREAIEALNSATTADSGVMAETWSSMLHTSLASNEELLSALQNTTSNEGFPDTLFGKKLEMITRLMQTASFRGVDRDFFYVDIGGFDTHSNVEENLASRFVEVNDGLDAFVRELKSHGLWEKMVLAEISDFARTLTPNSGDGTDHAWGGNYFMLGGDLNGGQILGEFPSQIVEGAPLNVGRGRIIPTTSWEHIWNGVSQWMGVPNDDLSEICPNRNNFVEAELFTEADLFNTVSGARVRERKMYLRN